MIVAGFGFRSGAALPSLRAAFALAGQGQPPVTHLATAHDKLAVLLPLAKALGLPLMGVASDALAAVSTPTRSIASLNARHVGSVAEASALAAAGAGACLLAPRRISPDRMATCAIAASVNLQEPTT
ncbi:cobalamin biosynthesis protein [Sphingobium phenoxybenzoativorans]|jgi:cobalt-precorrin 5A hydrolase|uniref:Cobalamin biosynthesis protein n=1 Tax=Sphingobium phenoxybenzoativorans TaxID=1592790 RepID=A0A975KA51_9SPHN|nr:MULTISPECIES: cobalamin biosynthesis protein [Sphingobium]MEA3388455.1 cobalamin biosynthesis protein [Pseudomonadota bacterium]QUT07636.1 cobalamin biosynthesis protein [Sphingobium phenoxybenzoativorans]